MPARAPDDISRPHLQFVAPSALAPGTATSNGGVLYDIIPVRGAARVRVRIKTATNGGTLDLVFLGPQFDTAQSRATGAVAATAYGSLVGTQYTTGNPTQVAVAAGTEAKIDADCYGESYVLVKFTGTVGAGTITYCDTSQV